MRIRRLFVAIINLFTVCSVVAGSYVAPPTDQPAHFVLNTNWGDNTVSLVDVSTGSELAQIRVGIKPYDIQVDPTGRFAYVSNSGSGDVSVIDIQAMLESHRIPVGQGPRDIDISRDGKWLVTANSGDDSISVVDIGARKEASRIKVGSIPYGVAFAHDDTLVAVTNWGEGTVSVVDLALRRERGTRIRVGALPYTLAVPQRGDFAFVSSFATHTIVPLYLDDMTAGKPVPVGRSPWGVALSPDAKTAIVANFYSGDVSFLVIDAPSEVRSGDATNGPRTSTSAPSANRINETQRSRYGIREVSRMPVSAPPRQVATAMNDIQAGGSSLNAGPTEGRAKNVAISGDGKTAVVSDLANNQLFVVDMTTRAVLRTVAVGKAPYGVVFLSQRVSASVGAASH